MDPKKIDKINSVSHCFCLAKWTQVTLDLVHGTNHSCHHPKRHLMDPEEVRFNPSALHNTAFKKNVRKEMLEGTRPFECNYCWNIEDTPSLSKETHFSDRLVKSTDPWSYPHLKEVLKSGATGDYSPHYVEVMFDNACNFACSYCLADISTSIKKEMNKFGKYPVKRFHHRMEDPEWKRDFSQDQNPFLEAFWKWLPEIWPGLQVLRVTGGEPLLSKHTFRLMEYCLDHPHPNLEISLNTNLGVEREKIERALELLKKVKDKGSLKEATLYVSVDTYGNQAEYIRHGLNYDQFMHNLQIFLESDVCERVTLMNTFNILSLPQLDKLIEDVANLKKKYPKLLLDMSYLKEPEYLRANMVEGKDFSSLQRSYEMVTNNPLFSDFEKNKLKRIFAWMKVVPDLRERESLRSDFFAFVNEYDKRYGKNFLQTFPELKDFYIKCKTAHFLLA